MGLNIKNDQAHNLAKELAQLTGSSLTDVVIDALQIRLKQLRDKQDKYKRVEDLMAIGARCAAHIHEPMASTDHGNLLYDEMGMPK